MNRILNKITQLKQARKKALISFITAGFPNERLTEAAVAILARNGADMIELGMPFSDPIADGPTIQASSEAALAAGMSVSRFLGLVKRLRKTIELPLIMMTYYNPLLQYGLKKFARAAAHSGLDGVIVPDLPLEEARDLEHILARSGIMCIFLVSPVTDTERLKKIAAHSKGFIYYVSLTGVTGARTALPADLARSIRRIKKHTSRPVYVGFGISRPRQVQEVCRIADGAIVGSAIVKRMGRAENVKALDSQLSRYVRSLHRMTQRGVSHG